MTAIETFYIVDKSGLMLDAAPKVVTVPKLNISEALSKGPEHFAIFVHKGEAVRYVEAFAAKVELLQTVVNHLSEIEARELRQICEAVAPENIENTLEGLNVYTE